MQITIEFLGLTSLSKALGKSILAELTDNSSVSDMIRWLVARHGKKTSDSLLDSTGQVDDTIQVIVNDEGFLRRDLWPDRLLKNGDTVKLMLLVGGG
uniref:MoaD/ThiS family protein n=1 Tax=Desulfatirhabdium butyrativorans TaxID=340467 RepID=A0A7C4W140_9BACT